MKKITTISLIVVSLYAIVLSLLRFGATERADTARPDTLIMFDTIYSILPQLSSERPLRNDTARLAVVKKNKDPNKTDQDNYQAAEVGEDSVNVIVPITQKVYRDSTYTAYVSGYNATLDSIKIVRPIVTVTIKEKCKPKRWGLGVQVGVTWNGKVAPYVGFGISYNIVAW